MSLVYRFYQINRLFRSFLKLLDGLKSLLVAFGRYFSHEAGNGGAIAMFVVRIVPVRRNEGILIW